MSPIILTDPSKIVFGSSTDVIFNFFCCCLVAMIFSLVKKGNAFGNLLKIVGNLLIRWWRCILSPCFLIVINENFIF